MSVTGTLYSHHEARVISTSFSGYTIGQDAHKPDTHNSETSAKIYIVQFAKGIIIYTGNGILKVHGLASSLK